MKENPKIPTEKQAKVKPKKRLGQNFLTEVNVINKLVTAARIQPGQAILEIGPGTGNLTEKLLETGNKVLAIEKDPEMIPGLESRFAGRANFELRRDDILEFDETKIKAPYKIAANLPFYLTGALIRKFLESKNPPASLTVIVQKEVAQRIAATPPDMNLLAVAVQFYAKPGIVSYVSKGCFWPAPKVDCAILNLELYPKTGEINDEDFARRFFKVMKAGFSQPRKQLAGNLAKGLRKTKPETENILRQNGIDPQQRAETLTMGDWARLANCFEL
jgi:16S rRNA (adenine1518-N6/adenine1519-N6)-dimethyltransferase